MANSKKSLLSGLGSFSGGRRGRGLSILSAAKRKSKGRGLLARLGGWRDKRKSESGQAFGRVRFSGRHGGIGAMAARSLASRMSRVEYFEMRRDVEDAADKTGSFYEDRKAWVARIIAEIRRRRQ